MSLFNRALYLQHILANPNTGREEYLWAQHELHHMGVQQLRTNEAADAYHGTNTTNTNDKLTGGQDV
jgi:hypothetical protein